MNGLKEIRFWGWLAHPGYIGVLGIVCYANTLGNGFVFDDSAYLASTLVRELAVGDMFSSNWLGLDIYRPLAMLSLGCDFLFFGDDPAGYHLTNLLLHLVNGLLLYALARKLLGVDRAALWAALLYICHPIQTEVVGWISARGDLLATMLLLGGYLAHLCDRERADWRWRLLAWVLYGAAVLAKETAVILPAVLLVHDGCMDRTADSPVRYLSAWLKRHWGYGVALAAVLALRVVAMGEVGGSDGPASTNFLADLERWQRLGTIVAILPRYVLLLAVPQRLSVDYSHASIPPVASPLDPWLVAGLVGIAVSLAVPWVVRSRFLAFAVAFFWLCLLPVSNLFVLAPSGMAERYLHLAMIPVSLALGWGGAQVAKSRWTGPCAVLAVLLLSVGTIDRNRDWRSDFTLFSAVLEHYPDNARAHDNLAFSYYQRGDFPRAAHHYQRAVAIQPTRLRAHFNLGLLYSQARRYEAALASFKTALALNPNHVETHFNLGLTYQKNRRYDEAIGHYRSTLALDPRHAKTRYNLGRAYERVSQPEAAVEQYLALIDLDPGASKAYYRLGELYYQQRRFEEMAAAWTTLLRLDAGHGEGERIRGILQRVNR